MLTCSTQPTVKLVAKQKEWFRGTCEDIGLTFDAAAPRAAGQSLGDRFVCDLRTMPFRSALSLATLGDLAQAAGRSDEERHYNEDSLAIVKTWLIDDG